MAVVVPLVLSSTGNLEEIQSGDSIINVEPNIRDITANSSVNVDDYILNCIATGNITLTLPLISNASIGRYYRIFTEDKEVSILPSGADLINGETSIQIKKYSMITLRALSSNNWRVGD